MNKIKINIIKILDNNYSVIIIVLFFINGVIIIIK